MRNMIVLGVAILVGTACSEAGNAEPLAPDPGAVATASPPLDPSLAIAQESDAVIHSCVTLNPGGSAGQIRIVDGPEACSWKESHLSWNQQGLPGQQGPQGEAGPAGPAGPQGPPGPGVAGTYRRAVNIAVPPTSSAVGVAECDPGDHLTGGGFENTGVVPSQVTASMPATTAQGMGWRVVARNETSSPQSIGAWAVCIQAAQ